MNFEDEKDYIMRIIKESVQLLFSLMLGKNYVSVEQELKNKYEVSGRTLDDLLSMADDGKINEAENIILDGIDYGSKNEVAAAALFYQHFIVGRCFSRSALGFDFHINNTCFDCKLSDPWGNLL